MNPDDHSKRVIPQQDLGAFGIKVNTVIERSILAPPNTRFNTTESNAPGPDNLPVMPMPTYRCRWIKCNAKLHNLHTLRGHILRRHMQHVTESNPQRYVCWWKPCEHLADRDDGKVDVTYVFTDEQEWERHIEEKHIQPLGRKYGDGPSTNTDHYKAATARRRFLSDRNGCEATPPIPYRIPDDCDDFPRDVLELTRHHHTGQRPTANKIDVKAQRAFLKAHGAKPGDQRILAEEVVRAMAVRKQKIGPGIDRGGCTLINEARRATFVQAPGISRIIEAEY